ncbi:flagellar basal body P-ring protein FlgI [Buchnera aphidicola (Muscaphis stroyani)]|uniref:Flagellar P-ring protein n=1 Tax=Buchnera aphidicola (Muscaphis stroyani) TaxID=1241869 RepID=A0A4D6YFJ0_9GAMM|nr:flagellar basal body P-ring protein FlgI [Buchnera aphidicola]QCI24410.1 flagellar basal body P-ring protein FlgI [Buchnera aphidicola (Muscaphis stroyani)]
MSKITLLKLILFLLVSFSSISYAEKIRDLTSIQGIRDNQLIGYGLIVGLDGTGDQSTQSPFTKQSLSNMLAKLGVTVPFGMNMNVKNVAAVMITAKLPPFSHSGEKIDVVVSSIGNSKSLRGGTLLMTPLKGADDKIYAVAQGNIIVPEKNNNFFKKNNFIGDYQVNSGRINHGATIEREINTDFGRHKTINLQLNQEDFSTAQRISDMINVKYPDTATPIDSKTVQLSTVANNNVQVHMLSNIQNIDIIMPSQEAKVIINSHTGSVVMNQEVTLSECAISNGSLSIVVHKTQDSHYENPLKKNSNKKKLPQNSTYQNYDKEEYFSNRNLNNIVRSLNALGTRTNELISILQSMKKAGCLHAKLEII